MAKDYRCSSFCPAFTNIPIKKAQLAAEITRESRFKNFYNAVKKQNSAYNRKFRAIYNSKCSYCGVSLDIQPYLLFEIDHFICRSHPKSKKNLDSKENLVFSCHICNRKKRDFTIRLDGFPELGITYPALLSPDDTHIASVFVRDSDYRIRIAEEYVSDDHIKAFYKKLLFDHPVRRLDYLLLELIGLIDECRDPSIKLALLEVKEELIRARNYGSLD